MKLMGDLSVNNIRGVSHHWTPANEETGDYGILRFGDALHGLTVYLHTPGEVDQVIAELVALRADMTGDAGPVITDSGRACDQRNPDGSGEPCHRDGEHARHRDSNGDEWGEAATAANPPHHAFLTDEKGCTAPGWDDRASGYVCTAQDGHDGPDHVAYKPSGGEYHRWPVAGGTPLLVTDDEPEPYAGHLRTPAIPAGPDDPNRLRLEAAPAGSGAPDWCPAFTVYDEGDDHLTLYCDRERGHHGSHHAPGPDEGSEVAWSDEAATAVSA